MSVVLAILGALVIAAVMGYGVVVAGLLCVYIAGILNGDHS